MPATTPEGRGRNSREHGGGASNATARRERSRPRRWLLEVVVDRESMTATWKQVLANKGAPGVDGMAAHARLPFCR